MTEQLNFKSIQYTVSQLKELNKALRAIKYGKKNNAYGLCDALTMYFEKQYKRPRLTIVYIVLLKLRRLFETWPEFSGSASLPIKEGAYGKDSHYIDKLCWEGEYGKARRRLLNHCIAETERLIKEGEQIDQSNGVYRVC